ncbi:PLP-dependent aminotransferase family protein [Methylobacterium longum]|uniref:8-amino-7-oxononanoate synthase n=1 Tax=Methylobacterium longum TaxID=767694 RepID=A0ABT8AYD4_9HYPH|nr:PLP-dependent aminotransferase family protein [Methylobacterium longum]MDN3574426.1 PLP-dependent aminotransferase family protein [Methylobacterium longum]GJE10274.1 Histidinol-phosphate aminotransferase [Methylobacterium longum]
MSPADFRSVADAIAADIAAGRLRPGERLPPQRDFAYARGIAVSTASRVYAELARRGLVTGEVGRGTYVRSEPGRVGPLQPEPPAAALDLQRTHSRLPEQEAVLSETLAALARGGAEIGFSQYGPAGTARAQAVAAGFLARADYAPDPADILFTGNGRQALAAALAALAGPGERIGCEPLTYPVVKGIAARLGITLVPVAMDAEGMCPDALLQAHRAAPLSGVYIQPTLQNPLGVTMGPARRADLARLLEGTGLTVIEDAVYSFLADAQPLASFAPDRTILIDSLSKRVMPALTVGLIAAPPHLTDRLAASVRQGAWTALGLSLAAGMHWMSGGSAAALAAAKRRDATARQVIARAALSDLRVVGDPHAYHLWLELPETWRAEAYAAAALRQGIALLPASAFAVTPGYAPNAVRLALAAPAREDLDQALRRLRRLAFAGDDQVVE